MCVCVCLGGHGHGHGHGHAIPCHARVPRVRACVHVTDERHITCIPPHGPSRSEILRLPPSCFKPPRPAPGCAKSRRSLNSSLWISRKDTETRHDQLGSSILRLRISSKSCRTARGMMPCLKPMHACVCVRVRTGDRVYVCVCACVRVCMHARLSQREGATASGR